MPRKSVPYEQRHRFLRLDGLFRGRADRGVFRARVALSGAVRPGVAVATGLYWNKLVPGLGNANSTTSTALTDMGGGATFFDNLVDVRACVVESAVAEAKESG